MRLNYLSILFVICSVMLSSCDGLPRTDEVDIAPYNVISGLSLPMQSQKKDNMLYVLDKKSYVYCIDLNEYSELFNKDLSSKGKSGTLSSNSPKNSKALSESEKIALKLPADTIRPKGINLSKLDYSLIPVSFSLTSSGTSLFIIVCVSCSDNSDIDGMYYILNFDTATKTIVTAIPLDKLTSYRVSDDESTDVTTDAEKSTGNVARQIYADTDKLFVTGNKRLFIIPLENGKVAADYDYYTDKEKSFISAETKETMSPYLVQVFNNNVYLSSHENNFGVHVYNYYLEAKTISFLRKEEAVNNVIGNHFPISMNIINNKLYCSSYEKLGIFNIENSDVPSVKVPIFVQTVSTRNIKVGQRSLTNHNKLLWRVEGADGVKTGFTKAAGRTLVSSAIRDGRRLICVTLNDGNDWADHATLLENGFSRYTPCQILSAGDFVGTVEVASGEADRVQLLAAEDFSFPLAETEKPQIILSGPGFAYAPVVQGEQAGVAYICIEDNCVGKVPVVYAQTIEQEKPPKKNHFWDGWFGD